MDLLSAWCPPLGSLLVPFLLAITTLPLSAQQTPAQQATAEQTAFTTARALTDPAQRTAALELFLAQFPASARAALARDALLQTYLDAFPENVAALHAVAVADLAATAPGLERWLEQARLADLLANAGTKGADLPDARVWATEAASSLTEPAYRRQTALLQARYKLPPPTPRQLRKQFAQDRATCLAALASVDIREARDAQAAALLAEASRLNPHSAELPLLAAQLALAQGNRQQALQHLLRAAALGPLPQPWPGRLLALFQELEHGDGTALAQRIDQTYRTLYPPVFTLPKRPPIAGGHPVLLELFTGSDCAPCAGPDLALDSLLGSYTRRDLIALAYDEPIPRPDPLANPDRVARAAFYDVASTPVAFLDGQPVPLLGASREDVQNVVVGLADQLEEQSVLASGLRLTLSVTQTTTGEVQSTVAMELSPVPPGTPSDLTTGDTSLRTLQRATLYLALAEDNVRYTGQNGIRFHRMVVRAMHDLPADTLLASSAATQTVQFDPARLDRDLAAYLADFETHNDRFGTFRFPTRDLPIDPHHLVVVAWVQDPLTRHILQSAFAPMPPELLTQPAPSPGRQASVR